MDKGIDISLLDGVIKKTIRTVEMSKEQIFQIAEGARSESNAIKKEIVEIRQVLTEVIQNVDNLELQSRRSRSRLVQVSRNFQSFTETDIRAAYEEAHNVQIELSLMRERENNLKKRRDELEFRLRNILETITRAEGLLSQISVVHSFLAGDLSKVEEALESAKQHQLMGLKIIQAQEEERKRVAREIHDGPAQSMANVVLRTEIVEKMLKNDAIQDAQQELGSLKEIVRMSLADVRKIIFDLRPMALDDLGLIPTLQKYIQTFEDRSKLHIDLIVFGKEHTLESSFKAAAFRLVQECLNNVYKHAKANFVQIKVEFQLENMFIVVKDDGIGFNVSEVSKKGQSFGIMGMKERCQLLNGRIGITSNNKEGTRVVFQIPLQPASVFKSTGKQGG
ncbi:MULTISPECIES: sensor histidine kinase [Brevibacillus]|uniref:sensor histidine kinase n=1 Tax=Brevibacillus TaxID=55080 RepID=UPI00036A4C28|nr:MULTISPECIES: histidine kinase [Brevibacillus]ATO49135.1 histidine kinase [Brevibacillus laterosporus DSM 25]MBG9787678.1 histidine kinase [Brevibacillus laterosporus]MBG9803617.1 histidine kinase [Brevibacillus laterosporus]MCG7315686.1 histidine kinase [Brevibacillus laterosporus]MED1789603.1 histidine kinase [Brevibacillus laterosporus]